MVCVNADVNKLYVLIQKIMMHAVTIKNNCHGHKSARKMNHVGFFFFFVYLESRLSVYVLNSPV